MLGLALLLAVTSTTVCVAQQYGSALDAQSPERLPPPAGSDPQTTPDGCEPVPRDTPLPQLTVDIRPRDLQGEVVSTDRLPPDCAGHLFSVVQSAGIGLGCSSCQIGLCELLQMAQYCHNPLYFEERLLERYGTRSCCCQPLQSAVCFYGNALCLPAKMWRRCPCSCVPSHPCD